MTWGRAWKDLAQDKEFFRILIPLAIPVVIQALLSSGMSAIGSFMVGRLGETAVAAVGVAGFLQFFMFLTAFGINSGAGVFGSQYWGHQDLSSFQKTQGLSLLLSMGAGMLLSVGSWTTSHLWLPALNPDAEVTKQAWAFLQISALTFPLHMVSVSLTMLLRSCQDTRTPMWSSIYSLGIYILVAAVLIYGTPWTPSLGILGAAWALVLAKIGETGVLFWISWKRKRPNLGSFSQMFHFPPGFVSRYFKITTPVILNEILWALLMLLIRLAYSLLGRGPLAAFSIQDTCFQIIFIAFWGTGAAASILVGHAVGRKDFSEARVLAGRFALLAPLVGLICGVILMLGSPWIPLAFDVSSETREWAFMMILILGFTLPIKAFYHDVLVGVLRGAGDTKYAAVIDLSGAALGVVLAWTAAFLLHLSPPWIYFCFCLQEALVAFILLKRLRSGQWIHRVIQDPADPASAAPKPI